MLTWDEWRHPMLTWDEWSHPVCDLMLTCDEWCNPVCDLMLTCGKWCHPLFDLMLTWDEWCHPEYDLMLTWVEWCHLVCDLMPTWDEWCHPHVWWRWMKMKILIWDYKCTMSVHNDSTTTKRALIQYQRLSAHVIGATTQKTTTTSDHNTGVPFALSNGGVFH